MTNEEGNAIARVIFALTGTEVVPSIDFNTAKNTVCLYLCRAIT